MTTRYWRPTRKMLHTLKRLKEGGDWKDFHRSTIKALTEAGWLHPRTHLVTRRGAAALWIYEDLL